MANVSPEEILDRWRRIRTNPECELSLEPDAVARFLRRPESEIVKNRIQEALTDLARYLLDTDGFESERPAGAGDLATCEGLEAFLVPAVEEAVPFSELLDKMSASDREKFVAAIAAEINGLVGNWSTNVFSGAPYGNPVVLRRALRPDVKAELGEINSTEAAAFACRVLVHLLTLMARRDQERLFIETIGARLVLQNLLAALKKAIEFLVEAFQKQEGGDNERQRIVAAKIEGKPGSGWSWTARQGLYPMLFFTASAVDAFAELDLYLIRPMVRSENIHNDLATFYGENKELIDNFQLCVDMARRWVDGSVLPWLSENVAQYVEKLPLDPHPYAMESSNYDAGDFKLRHEKLVTAHQLRHPPIVYYNNVYALLILLWSYSDWDASGTEVNRRSKTAIDQALAQIVRRYSMPDIHEFLNRFPNVFYLPGEQLFTDGPKARCEYLDSAFLPLLTRLLILFVVYGVGDRNLLEPVIRNLYVELLQSRYRSEKYSGLWSEAAIELYSTQRAVQALTFYYAYARGRELLVSSSEQAGSLLFRNTTGLDLVLEARLLSQRARKNIDAEAPKDHIEPPDKAKQELLEKTADGFLGFCRRLPGYANPKLMGLDPERDKEVVEFLKQIEALGNKVIGEVSNGRIEGVAEGEKLLCSLCELVSGYESSDRQGVFSTLEERYKALSQGQSRGQ
jgi:hypothetical protein